MSILMVTINEGHEHDYGLRSTSSGIALHHCTLGGTTNVLAGREVQIFDDEHRVRLDMLEGETRYRVLWAQGDLFDLTHQSGPFHIDTKDGRTALTCECGWVGKYRHPSALRYLVGDQVKHRCPR